MLLPSLGILEKAFAAKAAPTKARMEGREPAVERDAMRYLTAAAGTRRQRRSDRPECLWRRAFME
jgi:hypothetical protein